MKLSLPALHKDLNIWNSGQRTLTFSEGALIGTQVGVAYPIYGKGFVHGILPSGFCRLEGRCIFIYWNSGGLCTWELGWHFYIRPQVGLCIGTRVSFVYWNSGRFCILELLGLAINNDCKNSSVTPVSNGEDINRGRSRITP